MYRRVHVIGFFYGDPCICVACYREWQENERHANEIIWVSK